MEYFPDGEDGAEGAGEALSREELSVETEEAAAAAVSVPKEEEVAVRRASIVSKYLDIAELQFHILVFIYFLFIH